MKKILIFSLAYEPLMSGAELAVKNITDRIRPHDIEFHMLTLRFSSQLLRYEKVGNVHVHRIGGGGSYLSKIFFIPRAALTALRLNRADQFDAMWALMTFMTFPIALMRLMGVRIPYIITLQDGDPFEYVFKRWYIRIFSPLLYMGFRNATVIQVISNYLVSWPKRLGYQGRVEIIPNAVNVEQFIGERISHEGTVLITTSRLVHKNAVDDIIRALAHLPQHITLMVLGSGVEEKTLKALTQELHVEKRVQFLGNISNAKLAPYLHSSDIFIRPSRSEGFGISFIEAMAAGLPVIATQEGGIADFLFDAKRNPDKLTTGWAVDKDSPEQIATAVKEILNNPEQCKKVVDNARALVFSNYDWSLIAKQMKEKVFSKVLK